MKKLTLTKFLFSILLVGLGVFLLLVNTHIISVGLNTVIITFYPIIFIIIGFWLLVEPLITRGRVHWFWGLFFLTLGGLLSADRLGFITFHLSMFWKLWPLLLVYIGIKALSKGHHGPYKKSKKYKMKNHPPSSSVFHFVTDLTFDKFNWSVEPMDFWYMVGDYDFDFSKAYIPDSNTPIHLAGWVGDVRILIPEDIPFSIEGYANIVDLSIAGYKQDGLGKTISYKTSDFDQASRKITFHVDFKILDLRIDRV